MENNYIEIGQIVNTFGIKGELKVISDSDFVDYRFRVGATIYLKLGKNFKPFKVTSYRLIKGNPTIVINDLKDINLVNMYVGAKVFAPSNDIPPLEEGEYLVDDLVGLPCLDEEEKRIGKVSDCIFGSYQTILEITLLDGKTKLIPFVDEFILEVREDAIKVKLLEEEK